MQHARAIGRGHYDRALSPSQRVQEQRQLIYSHTLGLLAEPGAVVTSVSLDVVCRAAGVGRNTVYGLFGSATGLVDQCLTDAATACALQLDAAQEPNTPVEDVRALARDWIGLRTILPHEVAALLGCRREALVTLASERLGACLGRGVSAGTFAPDFEPLRLGLLSEAFVGALTLCTATESGPSDALATSLAELVLRASR